MHTRGGGQAAESWTDLGQGVGAVPDEYEGRDDVDEEPEDGDEVRGEPEGQLADEPAPPGLQPTVEEARARAAVLVLGQPVQLARREDPVLVEELHPRGTTTTTLPATFDHIPLTCSYTLARARARTPTAWPVCVCVFSSTLHDQYFLVSVCVSLPRGRDSSLASRRAPPR